MFKRKLSPNDLLTSKLYDQDTFYDRFLSDLKACRHEAFNKSPFITNRRLNQLMPTLEKLKAQHVRLAVNTKDPEHHDDEYFHSDARQAISRLQHMVIQVLFTASHHRKLTIIDRQILYEGSLNILSQNDSCEIMRRMRSMPLKRCSDI